MLLLCLCESLLTSISYAAPRSTLASTSVDPLPARALHADLLERFKSLTGKGGVEAVYNANTPIVLSPEDQGEDDKTLEELLADLGPSEQWNVGKTEHDEVEELLRAADTALKEQPNLENVPDDEESSHNPAPARLPAVDVSVFSPEPESDEEEEPGQTKAHERNNMNQEAEDVLQRLVDEVNYEKKLEAEDNEAAAAGSSDNGEEMASASLDFPAAPSEDLLDAPNLKTSKGDEDLAARFASLSLPSVPTALKSGTSKSKAATQYFADEEVDSWCTICNDDATLSCLSCDGDLYCVNCWLEGHRSEDSGYEERTHKAVQYVKGRGKKKQQNKMAMMGA